MHNPYTLILKEMFPQGKKKNTVIPTTEQWDSSSRHQTYKKQQLQTTMWHSATQGSDKSSSKIDSLASD